MPLTPLLWLLLAVALARLTADGGTRDPLREEPRGLTRVFAGLKRWLDGRWAPHVLGAITALLVWRVWGSLDAPGAYHDERAYLVQARLLADFTWTAPTPPVPMAWEMVHLFVEPALFAKYPPGHSPLLVPGVWLGAETLVPLVLAALSGALLFSLVRRVGGAWVALASWALWSAAKGTLHWNASYFSETTTTVLWFVMLHALLSWREKERGRDLILIVAAMAWMGITRPVTGIALGIPIACVVVLTAWRRRSFVGWRRAALIGVAICALVPYWNWRTIGSPTTLPYSIYSRIYFPFDYPGFTHSDARALRSLPPDFEALGTEVRAEHRRYPQDQVVKNLRLRTYHVARGALGEAFYPLMALVPLGLIALGTGPALFIGASALLMFAAYLLMPHGPAWTLYYLELFGLVPALAMLGAARAVSWLRARAAASPGSLRLIPGGPHLAAALLALLALSTSGTLLELRVERTRYRARQLVLHAHLRALEDPRALVLIKRWEGVSPHLAVVDVLGPPMTTPTWVVRSLGPASDDALRAAAGERAVYWYDERTMEFTRER